MSFQQTMALNTDHDEIHSGPRIISLQIPEGVEAGDSLTCMVEGKELEIPIPDGSKPGDVLEIRLGDPGDDSPGDASDPHEDAMIERIVNGKMLMFSTKCLEHEPTKDPSVNDQGSHHTHDGTHAHPWPAGMSMAEFWGTDQARALFHSLFAMSNTPNVQDGGQSEDIATSKGLAVLELGSGIGLAGLSFAAAYPEVINNNPSLPPLEKVILSDVQDGIALLKQNIELNCSQLGPIPVEARALLWSIEAKPPLFQYHLVLASDVLYNTDSIPALVATIKRHLSNSSSLNSALLLAVRWRKPQLERSFFEALDGWQGKHWRLIHSLHSPLSWRDYGNPACEASNLYFHQTMISIKGKPHSLAAIVAPQDDSQAEGSPKLEEQMTDQEADAFEQCHIQIYCLCSVDDPINQETKKLPETSTDSDSKEKEKYRKRPRES
jgi:predicted nicotinamide N-methyase